MLARRIGWLCLVAAALLFAEDWRSSESLPNVDTSGLTAAQKAKVLKVLRESDCSCNCGMKIAQCRMSDPGCAYSKGLAAAVVDAIKQGKTETQALAIAKASKWGQGPPDHNKLLEAPVTITTAGAPVRGAANAPVTVVEFSDFQCPFCIAATPELEALLKAYPSQVKLIFKEFPLDSHSQAALAAAAALAANKQGKFWEMYDALFAQKGYLSRAGILKLAAAIHLDTARFQADLDSADTKRAVQKDIADGEKISVDSTPTLFVDGQRYNGPVKMTALKPIVEAELKHPSAAYKVL
ncbi:MAG: thioredoxin domain-containing protein, partial [Acidobacteriia bacterium]|nr:thioredoxin domain-containing protein [Terriglobia bacterium]